jgi:hypothetical protein
MNLNENVLAVIKQVAANKGSRFASLVYTAKGSGEKGRHTILIGFDYHNAVVESLHQLKQMTFNDAMDKLAQQELIESFAKTIASHAVNQQNPDYTKKDAYESVSLDGQEVSGICYNKNDGSFKLFGLTVDKKVLTPGVYKEVKSSALVLAKNKISKMLPVSKFREFAIEPDALEKAKMNGETLYI